MLTSEITKTLKPANSPFFRAARSMRTVEPNNPRNVHVFSTSVQSVDHVRLLAPVLNSFAGRGRWNFALDDCDRILRIVSREVQPLAAIRLLRDYGFDCKELED